jgi:hypothetical protein
VLRLIHFFRARGHREQRPVGWAIHLLPRARSCALWPRAR